MTAPRSPHTIPAGTDPETVMDWFQLHGRRFMLAAVALAVLAGAAWFYNRSRELKSERAERAYYTAQRSLMAGNLPLAESDLKKMIARYEGTRAAMQARLVLAQIQYEQGKFQEGIAELLKGEDEMSGSAEFGSSAHLVLAAGYEQLGKFSDAATQFEKAARAARFDADRQRYESLAAHAHLRGGNVEKARQLWTALGADSKGVVAGEARVRLGELLARPQSSAGARPPG